LEITTEVPSSTKNPPRLDSADAALTSITSLIRSAGESLPAFPSPAVEDPVHWDPFLHAWVVTRYADVMEVLLNFSADRTPTPEQLNEMGLSSLSPIARGW